MRRPDANVRAQRTRGALHAAFATLIQARSYEQIEIADITGRAGVSRSTFYAHYRGKDALLAASIATPFAVLAASVDQELPPERLVAVLEHFWANREAARGILVGPVRRVTGEVLTRLIAARLRHAGLHRPGVLILPQRLAAVQLSEMLLAPLTAWLLGDSRCTPVALARALARVGVAALAALRAR
jgi:AcrR family transcriptional regulator